MKILDSLSSSQARILAFAFEKAKDRTAYKVSKDTTPNDFVKLSELQVLLGGFSMEKLSTDILHLRFLDLILRIVSDQAFHVVDGETRANITISPRGLDFMSQCHPF